MYRGLSSTLKSCCCLQGTSNLLNITLQNSTFNFSDNPYNYFASSNRPDTRSSVQWDHSPSYMCFKWVQIYNSGCQFFCQNSYLFSEIFLFFLIFWTGKVCRNWSASICEGSHAPFVKQLALNMIPLFILSKYVGRKFSIGSYKSMFSWIGAGSWCFSSN